MSQSNSYNSIITAFWGIIVFTCISCRHDADISELPNVYYNTDIQSIINSNCTMCHGEYSTYNGLMEIVKPGKPHQSDLYTRVTNPWAILRMPEAPIAPLTAQQRSTINLWILQGAPQNSGQ